MTGIAEQVLAAEQKAAVRNMARAVSAAGFYLAGGTGLALQLGHRRSVDFDWFCTADFTPEALASQLRSSGVAFQEKHLAVGTLHGTVSTVATTFLRYDYPQLVPTVPWPEVGISIAGIEDIACMKLAAVSQRGSRKYFADLYAIGIRHQSLQSMLESYQRKYSTREIGHVLAALSYFDDAEREPMPDMLWNSSWEEIRGAIREWVKACA